MSLCLDKPKNVSFKSDQKNNIVTVGETVKIICKAEGFPAPNYNIFHNCIKVTDNGVKIIKSVNIHDGGRYVCVAKNELGELSASFNLTVKGKNSLEICLSKMVSACHETVYIVQPSDKLLVTDVFILPLCHSFHESAH